MAIEKINPIEGTISEITGKLARKQDEIIRNAFRKHFGFDIMDVKDRENLEHFVTQGNPVESLLYRGETFLYITKTEIEYDPFLEKPEWPNIRATIKYQEV